MALIPPRYAEILARLLRPEAEPSKVSSWSDRQHAIETIEATMAELAVRAARRRRVWNFATLAALFLVGTGIPSLMSRLSSPVKPLVESPAPNGSSVTVVNFSNDPGTREPVEGGAELAAGSVLQPGSLVQTVREAGATLGLSTGTRLAVAPASRLRVIEGGRAQIFALEIGAVQADVAKLMRDQRFVVRTPDAEVEVRGTSFRVALVPVDPGCQIDTSTRVQVYEGVVVVRHASQEFAIRRGEEWPAGCSEVPRATNPRPAAVRGVITRPAESNLSRQNDLFAEAMRAVRDGKGKLAVDLFDQYLARYPAGQLAESASAERMQLLAEIDAQRASLAARQYLSRYPSGFARSAALRISSGSR